ncbi:DUF871 domain-containing protein [Fusibacter sp. JL216-2]|uniref:DUF871 domain-containing protein n=1 Tax=Fusibacter sp. JL216-2 TaxID=3071453 RepID=UPI003D33E279
MHRRLGISVYPENAPVQESIDYIKLAHKYGFTRVFTCLISATEENSGFDDFKAVVKAAVDLDMMVIADVSPDVFDQLGISHNELQIFKDMGLSGIRLDLGFSGNEESFMTFNDQDLMIEINMSNGTKYLDNILSFKPNENRLIGCHNFYPHRYTGLSESHFLKCSKQFKEKGIRTAAFVDSSHATFGPWPVSEGLCTVEDHRGLDIATQAKALFNTELIDDVIIANAFASEEELKALGALNPYLLELNVDLEENISEVMKKIVIEEPHFNRGDVSEYMIRSTQSRVKYKGEHFEAFNTPPIKRGDILIESSLYKRYAGELQIALKDMDNSGRTNVVGKIAEDEIYLLDQIEPWQKFRMKVK